MSAEEAATTTREAEEAEEPVAPGGTEETPAVEDTAANDAEASPATADASEDPSGAEGAAAVPDDEATDEVDELLAVGENLAGMTLADVEGEADADEDPQSAPVKTPDVFDRMGYGSSEDGDGGATIDELPVFIRNAVDALPTLARALALAP